MNHRLAEGLHHAAQITGKSEHDVQIAQVISDTVAIDPLMDNDSGILDLRRIMIEGSQVKFGLLRQLRGQFQKGFDSDVGSFPVTVQIAQHPESDFPVIDRFFFGVELVGIQDSVVNIGDGETFFLKRF